MEAQTWTVIVVLFAWVFTALIYLGRKLDQFEARIESCIDRSSSEKDPGSCPTRLIGS